MYSSKAFSMSKYLEQETFEFSEKVNLILTLQGDELILNYTKL